MTTVDTMSAQQTKAMQRPHPLLSVMAWELRRLGASRLTWILVLVTFGIFFLVIWLERGVNSVGVSTSLEKVGPFYGGDLAYDSVWRMLAQLTTGVLSLFTLTLPFLCADAIARDLRRRTHELVMTTSLPTWAYFWGRYVVVLALSLGMAVLLLAIMLIMALATHLALGGEDYPAPQIGLILAVWAILVLPLVLFVSSITFALGTLLPRRTNMITIGVIVLWFLIALILPDATGPGSSPPVWYTNWDPTSATLLAWPDRYRLALQNQLHAAGINNQPQTGATNAHVLQILHSLEYQFVDLWAWLGPHLVWTGLGLMLVLIAAVSFKRFRNIPA